MGSAVGRGASVGVSGVVGMGWDVGVLMGIGPIVAEGVGCGSDVSGGLGTSMGVGVGILASAIVGTSVGVLADSSTAVGLGIDVSASVSSIVGANTGTSADLLLVGVRAGSEVEGFFGTGVNVGTAQATDIAETKIVSTPNFNDVAPGRSLPIESFRVVEKSLICVRIQTKILPCLLLIHFNRSQSA